MSPLNLPMPIDKTWNVTWDSKTNNHTSNASGICVKYQKNKYASEAGVNFRAQPALFPCSALTLEYDVYFPADFDFVLGGKLPGMWGGEAGAGGGDWNDDGWSFRVMWREGGDAVGYVYMATDQGTYDGDESCKLVKNQGPGFDRIAHHTNGAGIDLWREAGLKFKRGQWNSVKLAAKINTPGTSDGVVSLSVNGRVCAFNGMRWGKHPRKIEGIAFATWFGGGSARYAPDKHQTAEFRGFKLFKG